MYQGVIAAARNAGDLDIWSGILMIAAVAILLLPLLAVPFIFGGFKAKQRKPRLDPELLKVQNLGFQAEDLPGSISSFSVSLRLSETVCNTAVKSCEMSVVLFFRKLLSHLDRLPN